MLWLHTSQYRLSINKFQLLYHESHTLELYQANHHQPIDSFLGGKGDTCPISYLLITKARTTSEIFTSSIPARPPPPPPQHAQVGQKFQLERCCKIFVCTRDKIPIQFQTRVDKKVIDTVSVYEVRYCEIGCSIRYTRARSLCAAALRAVHIQCMHARAWNVGESCPRE